MNKSKNSTRLIQRDILSSYFINKIYTPPSIIKNDSELEIEFNEFVQSLTENSYVKGSNKLYELGSNRLRFLIGDVGQGKSALVKKIISEICKNKNQYDDKYNIISIYINFEDFYNYGSKPKPLQVDFIKKFYNILQEKLDEYIDLSEIVNTSNINTGEELVLKKIFQCAKENNIRLILFIDNLDFYHYYSAKYSYFDEYYEKQNETINDNIKWLYSFFSAKDLLGNQGLNVLFSIRKYVYDDIISRQSGTDTEIDTTKAYSIKLVNESEVLSSRFELLKLAIAKISTEHMEVSKNLKLLYDEFRVLLEPQYNKLNDHIEAESLLLETKPTEENLRIFNHSPIKQISQIGQHGYRTLVHFFSSLNIAYLDFELIERFFRKQASILTLVYFTNIYQRYTQEKEHFPNLFLNDCMISYKEEFKNAHKGHAHTYWLKYFILKYIVIKKEVRFQKILDVFNIIGNYDEHLIRHVVGSLGTANEFRCIEYDISSSSDNILNRKLIPTNRGKYFFSNGTNNVEKCFDIQYLQVVIEDKWLSIPNDLVKEVYDTRLSYAHVYDIGNFYIDKSIEHSLKKAKGCLNFLKILMESYKIEIEQNKPELHKLLEKNKLIPDLDNAGKKAIDSSRGVIKAFKRTNQLYRIKYLTDLKKKLDNSNNLEFYNKYYNDCTDLKKVR